MRYLKITLPAILACFLAGIGWGAWTTQKTEMEIAEAKPLRVLCAENWLSESALHAFSKRHKVPVQLWTYARPSEFLRQMANSDGKVDVVCVSSFLLKSLIQSHWLLKTDFSKLSHLREIAVDFQNLPFDRNLEYGVPLFWNLYGLFGEGESGEDTWKHTWKAKRVGMWGEELFLLNLLERLGVDIEKRLQQEEKKPLEQEIRGIVAPRMVEPGESGLEASLAKFDWLAIPLARVVQLLDRNSDYKFWLPSDGGAMEFGLLSIGSKSEQVDLARLLIDDLLSSEHAMEVHQRLGAGVVHSTLSGSVHALKRAEALRLFPLTRLKFPDVGLEAIPKFQKIYDETLLSESNR